jgi:TPP-dependent pyruvate/acetoin dehydrogenase alpha subunit
MTVQLSAILQKNLLSQMMRIRLVEEAIAYRYAEGKMRCPTHLSIGQEAVAAAVGQALRIDDFAVSTHRAHAHYLGKGGNLNAMIAEIYGKATGCSKGRGGSMHLIDLSVGFQGSTAIVGNSIPIGVGLGLSVQLQNTDQVSCVFLGDGSIEEGVFYESANFSAVKKLPVIFICENNLYSVYSPLCVRQPEGRRIHEMVRAMGLSVNHGDGNDVEYVYTSVAQAIHKIRSGGGPQFLEFDTYRWREHCGPNYDNDIGYRSESEFEDWKLKDPIIAYQGQLLKQNTLTKDDLIAIERKINDEIAIAFDFAERSPFPSPQDAFTHLYKD